MNDEYTDNIFKLAKISKQIICVPFALSFRYCNNNCQFCYLKSNMKTTPLSLEESKKLCDNCINWFKDNAHRFEPDMSVFVEMIGGELYIMDDDYYQLYYDTLITMYNIAKENNIPFSASLVSNLLLDANHLQKFINLYQKVTNQGISVEIVTSFDLWGRFKTTDLMEQWLTNLELVSETIKQQITIEFILSKPNIEKVLNNDEGSQIFDYLVSNNNLYNIILNEYVPNSYDNIQYVANNELIVDFYKKLIDTYDKDNDILEILHDYDIDNSEYKSCAYKEECCGPAFGIENTLFDTKLDLEEYGIYKLYCAEIGLVAPWGKSENVLKRGDLYKIDVPNNQWICVDYPDQVKYYFDQILGCGSCRFKDRCFKTKRQGCYITHQFKWKEDKCWLKPVFQYAKTKGLIK